MRRADRLLQIVQMLRRTDSVTTAQALADELEVVPQTIYRDIAALQPRASRSMARQDSGNVLRPG